MSDAPFSINVTERKDTVCRYHIKFLETLCKFWPIERERERAVKESDVDAIVDCNERLKPLISDAKLWLNEVQCYRGLYYNMYQGRQYRDPKSGKVLTPKPKMVEAFRESEDKKCKEDIVHWVNHYCWTFDQRLTSYGLPAKIPMVMWPKQEEFVLTVLECYRYGIGLCAPKSRAYGLSYLFCCFAAWGWMYIPGFGCGMGSRIEEYVDSGKNPKSLFWKVRHIIYNLPPKMRPEGFEKRGNVNDNKMVIYNPANGATITGEGGDNIGAGDRTSVYLCDEKALHLDGNKIDTSLSQTTKCQIDISTIRGFNHFTQKSKGGKVRTFFAWWYHDPAKNPDWRIDKKPGPGENVWRDWQDEKFDPVINAQEVDIDPQASVEDAFIPPAWVRACVDFELPADGIKQGGFDVAAGGKNNSVYVSRIGPVTRIPRRISFDTPNEAAVVAVKYGEEDLVEAFVYDQDGVGESVFGTFKVMDYELKFPLMGVHGNSPAPDTYIYEDGEKASEKFDNIRAYNWWNLREKCRKTFEHRTGVRSYSYDEMVSLPNDEDLVTQLSQPKRVWRGKKIGVEKKVDMHRRGVASPDLADACVNAHAPIDWSERVISKLDYRENGNVVEFDMDFDSPIGEQYVSLYQTQDMKIHALSCWWRSSHNAPLLRVYWEFVETNPDIALFCREIEEVMCAPQKPVRKWLCNDAMYDGAERGRIAPYILFRREAKVSLHRNYIHDMRGSIMMLNAMLDKRILEIHQGCEKLWMQLTHWRMKKGKPQDEMGLSLALCQMVSYLKRTRKVKDVVMMPSWKPAKLYRGAMGHFGRTAKPEEAKTPSYFKKAQEYASSKK